MCKIKNKSKKKITKLFKKALKVREKSMKQKLKISKIK